MERTEAEEWERAYSNPVKLTVALKNNKTCDFDYTGYNQDAVIAVFDDYSRLEISPDGIKVLTK